MNDKRARGGARLAWRSLYLSCAVVSYAVYGGAAQAQSGPGTILPQGSPIPRVLPTPPPAVAPALPLPGPAAPAAVSGVAPVRSVSVVGATAYPAQRLNAITAGLTGPAVPVQRIEAARVAIVNLYRNDGYALTTVTATVDAQDALHFTVTEGRIAEVKLDGNIGPAGTQVLRFLQHLTEVRPIDTATLERWLLLAQDVPGVTLHAVLQPSTSEPGALTLVAQVDHKVADGLLSVDNRAFQLTGREQAVAVLDVNSLTSVGERTTVTLYHTNGNTQNFGQASVEGYIGGSGLKLRVYGGYGEANPSEFLRAICYHGTTTVFGASLTYPLIRARQQNLNLSLAFDAEDSDIHTDSGTNGGSVLTGRDALRIARLGADYALEDGLLGDDRPAINSASVRLSQGIPSFGASSNHNADATRLNARTDFTKISFDVSRVQTLFHPWSDASVALKARALGQATGDVLPPAEEFFLGGADYNRGYYSGEVTGDNALVLSAELQLNTEHQVPVFGHVIPITAQYYTFFDYGETWQNQSLDANARLSSVGGGVRLMLTRYTEVDLEGVHRNTRHINGNDGTSPLAADAFYWRVLARF